MLLRSGLGVGSLALLTLLADEGRLCAADGTFIDTKKLKGKAKSVILLFMGGGPSQVDTFDPKPLLTKLNGKEVPESIAKDIPKIARAPLTGLFGSPYSFEKHGECGLEVSEIYPHVAKCIDDICIIRSMVTVHWLVLPRRTRRLDVFRCRWLKSQSRCRPKL